MRPLLYLSAVVLVVVCASWAYRVNYETRAALDRVAALRSEIDAEREALGILRAEWAYLNRPDRLRALVDGKGAALGLTALAPEQFGAPTMIAYPVPPDAPDDEIANGIVPVPASGDAAPERAPEHAGDRR